MIYRGSTARRYGHRLLTGDARADVLWWLESGASYRHHASLVDRSNELRDEVVRDVFQIGPSADMPGAGFGLARVRGFARENADCEIF